MALSIGELVGYVDLDTSGVTRGLSKTDSALGKTRSSFGSLAKFAAGAFAAVGAVKFFGDAFGEAEEAAKVGAQTAAVIKSTGAAANVTAGQVANLAGKISAKSGIDDEAIQTGQNLLLTFKNIKNEAGKGNDIFDQTTQTMVDMSAAMGTDAKGSAVLLGKALNDPTKGLSALSRVGVSFTAQQEKQIKKLHESGKTMAAQKIILKELKSEFGGSAAAIATPADKARVAWGNFKEQVGTAVMPVVSALATFATNKLIPAIGNLIAKIRALAGPAIKSLVSGWRDGTGTGGKFRDILTDIAGKIAAVARWAVKWQDVLVPLAGGILAIVAAIKVWRAVTAAYTAVQAALNVVLMANPIGLIVLAIVGLVAGLVIAYKKSETFRKIVQGAFRGVVKAAKAVGNFFVKTLPAFFTKAWNKIKSGATAVGNFFTKSVPNFFRRAWDTVKSLVTSGASKVWSIVKALPGRIANGLSSLKSKVGDIFSRAMEYAKDKVVSIGGKIKDWIAGIPGRLADLGGRFGEAGRNLLQRFIDGMKNAAGIIAGIAGNVWDTVKGLLNGAIDRINASLDFTINLPGPKDLSVNIPNIPHLATGGRAYPDGRVVQIADGGKPETVLTDPQIRALLTKAREAGRGDVDRGRNAPHELHVHQRHAESAENLSERLHHKLRTRG